MVDKIFNLTDELFDSHCHLNEPVFDADRDVEVEAAVQAGVTKIVDVAEHLSSSQRAVANAKKYEGIVFATVGVDPHVLISKGDGYFDESMTSRHGIDETMRAIEELINDARDCIVALGETGMDFYWYQQMVNEGKLSQSKADELIDLQEYLFEKHLELGVRYDLPLTVHSRAAEERCLAIAKNFPAARGVFHSYTGSYETATQILDAGWGLGVNGIVTFKNSQEIRDMYHKILGDISPDWSPADFYAKGIYFETDAPFLTPEGKRGERNQPAYVADIFTATKARTSAHCSDL